MTKRFFNSFHSGCKKSKSVKVAHMKLLIIGWVEHEEYKWH